MPFFSDLQSFSLMDYSFILLFPIDDVMTDPFFLLKFQIQNYNNLWVATNNPSTCVGGLHSKEVFCSLFRAWKRGKVGPLHSLKLPVNQAYGSVGSNKWNNWSELYSLRKWVSLTAQTEWRHQIMPKYPPVNSHGNGELLFTPGNTSSNGSFPIAMFICRSVMFET